MTYIIYFLRIKAIFVIDLILITILEMKVSDKKINQIVAENYITAAVLHYFGIRFYDYSEYTLAQVCRDRGLDVAQVVKSLETIQEKNAQEVSLIDYPIDLVIQYLKHSHYVFVNKKLPYMASLIEDLDRYEISPQYMAKDLHLFFPLFVEEFIHHIHEEEDTFFRYISILHQASVGKYSVTHLYQEMEAYSIQFFALDHHSHDDEMRGIRDITNNYNLPKQANLHLKVVFAELQALEKELITHARIEDEILFPKALKLENLVKQMLQNKFKSN